MKKIFTLLCICCLGFGAMAQLPINLGVHGGISSNRIKFKDIPQAIGTQANTGYMVGAFMRVNLGKLYLEPALNYSHKRSVIEEKAQALGEQLRSETQHVRYSGYVGFPSIGFIYR